MFIDTAGAGYEEAWNDLLESRENEGEARLALYLYQECARPEYRQNRWRSFRLMSLR